MPQARNNDPVPFSYSMYNHPHQRTVVQHRVPQGQAQHDKAVGVPVDHGLQESSEWRSLSCERRQATAPPPRQRWSPPAPAVHRLAGREHGEHDPGGGQAQQRYLVRRDGGVAERSGDRHGEVAIDVVQDEAVMHRYHRHPPGDPRRCGSPRSYPHRSKRDLRRHGWTRRGPQTPATASRC